MSFEDHFSRQSSAYARYRPSYPAALFDALAHAAPGRSLAWDAGTGNGQAAVGLAELFERVVATDASAAQLSHTTPHPRVAYRVARSESCGLEPLSIDVAVAAQALHWFEMDDYFAEVRRVLRPAGVAAFWCYETSRITPAIDAVMLRYYREVVGAYWPSRQRWVMEHYNSIPVPFDDIPAPADLAASSHWTLADAFGFLTSWSASQAYIADRRRDPLDEIRDDLTLAWSDPVAVRPVEWPLFVRFCRKTK